MGAVHATGSKIARDRDSTMYCSACHGLPGCWQSGGECPRGPRLVAGCLYARSGVGAMGRQRTEVTGTHSHCGLPGCPYGAHINSNLDWGGVYDSNKYYRVVEYDLQSFLSAGFLGARMVFI